MHVEIPGGDSIQLSDIEKTQLLNVIETGLYIESEEDFFRWNRNEIQAIFPHSKLICGVGKIGATGAQLRHILGHNFPDEYVAALKRTDGLISSPIIVKWMKEKEPVLFDPDCEGENCREIREKATPGWLENFRKYELENLAAHGLWDADNHTASYFSFSGIPGELGLRHAKLLKLLVPHMHVALTRVIAHSRYRKKKKPAHQVTLTPRQFDILNWMATGKGNWEIAQVMGLSESTVKNHVHCILAKLHATSRAQAVAKAISQKLINAHH